MEKFMEAALQEAYEGIEKNHGGPFGAVVVKNGKIVGRMEAIRDACKNLGTHDLTGCQLYTTAEPCPMCLGGILWSNIQEVYFGCDRIDTDRIGFRDDVFYEYLDGKNDILSIRQIDHEKCLSLFEHYEAKKAQRY